MVAGKANFAFAADLKPFAAVQSGSMVLLAKGAPHPNAVKLVVKWIMGDADVGPGFELWHDPGVLPGRPDMPLPGGTTIDWDTVEEKFISIDPDYVYSNMPAVRDFWVSNLLE